MEEAFTNMPKAKAKKLTEEEFEKKIDNVAKEAVITAKTPEEEKIIREDKKNLIRKKEYKVEPVSYPQTILFETEHIFDKIIIKLNINHSFYKQIFEPLCGSIEDGTEDDTRSAEQQKIRDAILILLLSYGKAETFLRNKKI